MRKNRLKLLAVASLVASSTAALGQNHQTSSPASPLSLSSAAQLQGANHVSPTSASRTSGSGLSWMHTDVGAAHARGFRGQGATITIVDDHRGRFGSFDGNLTGTVANRTHGAWVAQAASLTAPHARIRSVDFVDHQPFWIGLDGQWNRCGWWCWRWETHFNVLNLSYGLMAPANNTLARASVLTPQTQSIIHHARTGQAVVVKSAGNDGGIAVGGTNRNGQVDLLSSHLIGARAAIFAGALNSHGTTSRPATMASYSNVAGTDRRVQNQFLVVGVEADKTGMAGTSFAAPIISGYAAVVHSKFRRASPTQVVNQLLTTARTDTVANYNRAVHGRGEASLSRALAPSAIR